MRFASAVAAGICLALILGIGSAWLAVRSPAPVDAITIGPWQAWPNAGTDAVDPYSHARLARTGEIPLGSGEGLALFAQNDNRGETLNPYCDYRIVGLTPPARLWTLAIEGEDGRALATRDDPHALGSDAVLRASDGSFAISVGRKAAPGNWLSSENVGRFRLVMRLYDTTARSVSGIDRLVMPRIELTRCA